MKRYNRPQPMTIMACAATFGLGALSVSAVAQHAHEGGGAKKSTMKSTATKDATANMPRIQEKGVMTVTGDENWDEITGFGKESGMTEMMTQMMVGGSGMEHMKMAPMKPGMKMSGMAPGMKMGGMAKGATDQAQGMPVTVSLAQNPPTVGDNTLDVLVTDASGKPATGLKLMATVAMTSMDMGTERPKAVEGKDGHYSVPVKFSMKGPWRVVLMNAGKADKNSAVNTTLDLNVDGKTKWVQHNAASGMKMVSGDGGTMKDMKMPATTNLDTKGTKPVASNQTDVKGTAKDVKTLQSDQADVKGTAGVSGDHGDTKSTKVPSTDHGDMKGMEMPAAGAPSGDFKITVKSDPKTFRVGKNTLDVLILDANGKPVSGAKVMSAVEMTSMDMGVTKPKAQEGKDGHYTVPVQFSMKGPWRVTLTVTPPKQKQFTKAFDFKIAQ